MSVVDEEVAGIAGFNAKAFQQVEAQADDASHTTHIDSEKPNPVKSAEIGKDTIKATATYGGGSPSDNAGRGTPGINDDDNDAGDKDDDVDDELDTEFANPVGGSVDWPEIFKDIDGRKYRLIFDNDIWCFLPRRNRAGRRALEKEIRRARGIPGKIVVFLLDDENALVVDGYERLAIAQKCGLDFDVDVCPASIKTRDEAVLYRVKINLERRNLHELHIKYIRGMTYESMKTDSKGNLKLRWRREGQNDHSDMGDQEGHPGHPDKGARKGQLGHPDGSGSNRTADKLAAVFGISPRQVRRCAEFFRDVEEHVKQLPEDKRAARRNAILAGKFILEDEPSEKPGKKRAPGEEQSTDEAICNVLEGFANGLGKQMRGYTPDLQNWKRQLEIGLQAAQEMLDELKERVNRGGVGGCGESVSLPTDKMSAKFPADEVATPIPTDTATVQHLASEIAAPLSTDEATAQPPTNEDPAPPTTNELTTTPLTKKAATPVRGKRRSATGSRSGSGDRGGSTSMNPIPAAEALNGADRSGGSASTDADKWHQYAAQRREREANRDEDAIGG